MARSLGHLATRLVCHPATVVFGVWNTANMDKAIFINKEYVNIAFYSDQEDFSPGRVMHHAISMLHAHLGDFPVEFSMVSTAGKEWKSTLKKLSAGKHKMAEKLQHEKDMVIAISFSESSDEPSRDYDIALNMRKYTRRHCTDRIQSVSTCSIRIDIDTRGGITKIVDEYVKNMCAIQAWAYGFVQPMFLSEFGSYATVDGNDGVASMASAAEARRWWAPSTDRSLQVRGVYWGNILNSRTVAALCEKEDLIEKWSEFHFTNVLGQQKKGRQRLFRLNNGSVYLTLTNSVRECGVSYGNTMYDTYTFLYDEMNRVFREKNLLP
jgi:hypothetical protein